MTKARTNAAKLAAKRNRKPEGLPDLAPIGKRPKQHRTGGKFARPEEDASIPAIQARCRQAGIGTSEADMREAKAQWSGCEAGRAMASQVKDDAARSDLWDAIQKMRMIQVSYDRAIGAPRRHAQCLRLMLPIEPMETDASAPPPDLRTEDERYRQAINGWMEMHAWLGCVEGRAASITLRAVIDDEPCKDASAMVRALHCVADGMAGRKIVYRGIDRRA